MNVVKIKKEGFQTPGHVIQMTTHLQHVTDAALLLHQCSYSVIRLPVPPGKVAEESKCDAGVLLHSIAKILLCAYTTLYPPTLYMRLMT